MGPVSTLYRLPRRSRHSCASPCASHFVCPAASCTPAAVLTTERAAARQAPNAPQTRKIWLYERKGRDSNPGDRSRGLTVFKTAAFNRSATLPAEKMLRTPLQDLHWVPANAAERWPSG